MSRGGEESLQCSEQVAAGRPSPQREELQPAQQPPAGPLHRQAVLGGGRESGESRGECPVLPVRPQQQPLPRQPGEEGGPHQGPDARSRRVWQVQSVCSGAATQPAGDQYLNISTEFHLNPFD